MSFDHEARDAPATRAPAPIAWAWRNAAHGAALALPAAVASLFDPALGIPLAVGVLPAAAVGLVGPRRGRARVVIVGAVAAVSLVIGSLVAAVPALAVATILVLCVGVAVLAAGRRRMLSPLALMLGLPLIGAGLSETPDAAVGAGVLIVLGSIYGWVISLPWPDRSRNTSSGRQAAPRRAMLIYGIQIGAAGAAAAALGFLLGVDHPGWACAAALLVSRPDTRLLDTRSAGRILSVLLGAAVACIVAAAGPPPVGIAVLALAAVGAAAATARSRWYVMPFFSTLLVLTMLIGEETEPAAHWFLERVVLTIAGVALALVAALVAAPFKKR